MANIRRPASLAAAVLALYAVGASGDFAGAAPAPAAAPSAGGSALVFASSGENLTARQKLDYADEALKEMQVALVRVERMADEARKDKDIIRLNCLHERLATLKGLLKIAQQAAQQMRVGLEKENADLAASEFTRLAVAREQAQRLVLEADACVGEVDSTQAGTGGRWAIAVVDVVEEIPEDYGADPSGYTRPPEATPFN